MKCPKCGNELRISKKDPSYGLCDDCRKKYRLPEKALEPEKPELPEEASAQKFSNIPPKHVRDAREKEMRKGYDDLQAAGDGNDRRQMQRQKPSKSKPSKSSKKKSQTGAFKTPRLVIGIFSIVLSLFIAFQSFAAGLSNILSSSGEVSGSAGIILAGCLLLAGILTLCLKRRAAMPAFLVPAVFYIAGAVVAAANTGSYKDLRIWAVVAACFGALHLLFLFLSRDMKPILGILAAVLVIVLVGALIFFSKGDTTESKQDTGKGTTTAADKDKGDGNEADDGVINLSTDDFDLKYTKLELASDYDGKQCVIIYFDFTNKQGAPVSATAAANIIAFQNGVECEVSYLMDSNEGLDNALKEVQTGATLNVAKAFLLTDTSDVDVEASALISLDGTKDTQTLSLQ